ncbi:MAG: cryptochrome/photolyase family protein, partial [Cyanobacteria bacterium J06641_5]
MVTGIWILGDRLSVQHAALQQQRDCQSQTPVLLVEAVAQARQHRYHAQKLVLVWSAMRHFAAELREAGWLVTYEIAEDFWRPLQAWIVACQIDRLLVMQPSDRTFAKQLETRDLGCELEVLPESLFLWSVAEFQNWANGRKRLVLEDFYREGRRKFNILMAGEQPIGGAWNFDKENRKPPKKGLNPPPPLQFEPDEIVLAVCDRVRSLDIKTYGQIEPFTWGVTRAQALQALAYFITERLPMFGPYQDAMVTGEQTLWHALLSPYLNLALLHPLEVSQAAEAAYRDRDLPINGVEGFIRQILGWRE